MTPVKLEDIRREDLEIYIYEGHRDAFGVKGRHYDFESMSMDDLRKEAEYIADAIDEANKSRRAEEAKSLREFRAQIRTIREMCNVDRDNAIRILLDAEGFLGEYDPSYICYSMGLPYSMAKYIEPRLTLLNKAA
jgi:hypothetical protein